MRSLRVKITLFFSCLIILSSIIITFVIFNSSISMVKEGKKMQLEQLVSTVVDQIYVEQYKHILEEGENSPAYEPLRKELLEIKNVNNLEYLFTLSKKTVNNEDIYYYVVDGGDKKSDTFSSFGDEEDMEVFPAIKETFETGKAFSEITESEEYGVLFSYYTPIKDNKGEIVGVLGADLKGDDILQLIEDKQKQIIITIVLIVIVSVIITIIFSRYLSNPLNKLASDMSKVTAGDLTVQCEIVNRDEIGRLSKSFNALITNMTSILTNMKTNAYVLQSQGEKLYTIVQKNDQLSTNVSQMIQDISLHAKNQKNESILSMNSIEEMMKKLQEMNESSVLLMQAVNDNLSVSKQGTDSMILVENQMHNIQHSIKASHDQLNKLDQQVGEISQILSMIHTISKQTNLLALNASIEAARAGAYGKGFSIVADEIRTLSEATANAVNEIAEILKHINVESKNTVQTMSESVEETEKGTKYIASTKEVFDLILQNADDIKYHIDQVAIQNERIEAESVKVKQAIEHNVDISKDVAEKATEIAELTIEQKNSSESVHQESQQLIDISAKINQDIAKFKLK